MHRYTLTLTHTFSYYMCVCVRMRAYVRIFTRKPEFLNGYFLLDMFPDSKAPAVKICQSLVPRCRQRAPIRRQNNYGKDDKYRPFSSLPRH